MKCGMNTKKNLKQRSICFGVQRSLRAHRTELHLAGHSSSPPLVQPPRLVMRPQPRQQQPRDARRRHCRRRQHGAACLAQPPRHARAGKLCMQQLHDVVLAPFVFFGVIYLHEHM